MNDVYIIINWECFQEILSTTEEGSRFLDVRERIFYPEYRSTSSRISPSKNWTSHIDSVVPWNNFYVSDQVIQTPRRVRKREHCSWMSSDFDDQTVIMNLIDQFSQTQQTNSNSFESYFQSQLLKVRVTEPTLFRFIA